MSFARSGLHFRRTSAFCGIAVALGLSLARPSAAQQGMGGNAGTGGGGAGGGGTGGSGTGGSSMTGAGGGSSLDDPGAQCTSAAHGECAERCPSFATCFVSGNMGSGRLYYRVDEQRFDCANLDCGAANLQLGDYCCERGEFAPDDDGGGCALSAGVAAEGELDGGSWLGLGLGLFGASVALYRRRRARQQ